MDFIDLDLDLTVLKHQTFPDSHTGRPRRQPVRVDRREKVRLSALHDPTLAARVADYNNQMHPIYHADGVFYACTENRWNASPQALLVALFEFRSGVLGESDIAKLGQRFAVHGETGALLERIHEPVWIVETKDTGGRMNVRENAKQGVSFFLSYVPRRPVQAFDGAPVPRHGSPRVMFALTREKVAEQLLPRVAADTGWGQVERYHRIDQIEMLRPDLFMIDDRAGSLRMIGPMMIALGHAVCPALSRAGIERWVDLRRRVGAAVSERDYAEIQGVVAGLFRELSGLRSENKELDVMIKRARNCAAMFVHRLDVDNSYTRESDIEFDLDGHGVAP